MQVKKLKMIFDSTKIAVLSRKEGLEKISLNDIVYIEARGNISIIYLSNKAAGIPVSKSIGYFERSLPPSMFCRLSRRHILGMDYFEGINREKTRIFFKNDKVMPVTPGYLGGLMDRLEVVN